MSKRESVLEALQPYPDHELDAAMREREQLEAAERDLDCIRRYAEVKSGRFLFFGKWFSCIALCFAAFSPGAALADAPKVKKPVVCVKGTPVAGEGFSGFMCLDGKRPRLLTRHVVVKFIDEHGNPRQYVLGWTTIKAPEAPAVTVKL
jgi:hypothetical protein